MGDYYLSPATQKNKRYQIKTPDNKIISFGAEGGSTFIDHKNLDKKNAWIARHKAGNPEAWSNKNSPLFWARVLLWNQPTLSASIKDVKQRYNIKVRVS